MFIFLSKALPLFIYPLGLACVLLLVGLSRRRGSPSARWFFVAALLGLWLSSTRWVSTALVHSLESRYPPLTAETGAEMIVVLGGGTVHAGFPRPLLEVNEGGDRLIYAAWLYREQRAPSILHTGGIIGWLEPAVSDGETLPALMALMGVPSTALWLETASRNTYENALFSRQMLEPRGIKRILLVTSALHMPRSVRLFEAQGFDVIPAPTDFLVTQADWEFLRRFDLRSQLLFLLPDPLYLYRTTLALKEYVGLFVYDIRGWL